MKSDCNTDLNTVIMITVYNKKEILKSVSCNFFVQVIPNTAKNRTASLTGILRIMTMLMYEYRHWSFY